MTTANRAAPELAQAAALPVYRPIVPLPLPDPFDQQSGSRLPRDLLFIVVGGIVILIALTVLLWITTAPWRARRQASLQAKRTERQDEQRQLLQAQRRSRLSLALGTVTVADHDARRSRDLRPTSIYDPGRLSYTYTPQSKRNSLAPIFDASAEVSPCSSQRLVESPSRHASDRLLQTPPSQSSRTSGIRLSMLNAVGDRRSLGSPPKRHLGSSPLRPASGTQTSKRLSSTTAWTLPSQQTGLASKASPMRPSSQVGSGYLPAGYYRRSGVFSASSRPSSMAVLPSLRYSGDMLNGFGLDEEMSMGTSLPLAGPSLPLPKRKQLPPQPPTEALGRFLDADL